MRFSMPRQVQHEKKDSDPGGYPRCRRRWLRLVVATRAITGPTTSWCSTAMSTCGRSSSPSTTAAASPRCWSRRATSVKKGQVLARLDTSRLKPQVANAEAQVAAQQAAVERLHNGSRPEEIAQARANRRGGKSRGAERPASNIDRKTGPGGQVHCQPAGRRHRQGGHGCGRRQGGGEPEDARSGDRGAARGGHRPGEGAIARERGAAGLAAPAA